MILSFHQSDSQMGVIECPYPIFFVWDIIQNKNTVHGSYISKIPYITWIVLTQACPDI